MATTLATLIARMEGWGKPDVWATLNNNPGNLRNVGQAGVIGTNGGYAVFATPDAGWAALERQLRLDAAAGDTVATFINSYAPPSENDTGNYLSFLVAGLGVPATTPLTSILGQQVAQVSPPATQTWDYAYNDGASGDGTGGGVSADFGAAYNEAGILGDLGQVPTWAWLGLVAGAGILVMVKGRD
jgi:hypothetical protein